ncbi:MAG TPA: AMP-binding protein, partial [Egibacteraceae bacterium]
MTDWVEAIAIGDLLLRTAERRPDHEALVFPYARYTYDEVRAHALRAARSLAGLGVGKGDHVGLLMPNCPDFVFTFFGAQLLGAVVVPINTRFRTRELAYVVENADLSVLVTSDIVAEHVDLFARLSESLPELGEAADPFDLRLTAAPRLRSVVLLGDREPPGVVSRRRFEALADEVAEAEVLTARARVRLRDIALMPYTSGTTSQPKGCLLTHEALVRDWVSAGRRLTVTADERFW